MKHTQITDFEALNDADLLARLFPAVDVKARRVLREERAKLMRKGRREAIARKRSWLES